MKRVLYCILSTDPPYFASQLEARVVAVVLAVHAGEGLADTRQRAGCGGEACGNAAACLGTRPNISESHSETSTRVPFCITQARLDGPRHQGSLSSQPSPAARLKRKDLSSRIWVW